MATCATLGQAVGTAAAIAIHNELSPKGVFENKLRELQQTLMVDDCYLPRQNRQVAKLTEKALLKASDNNTDVLRNGADRSLDGSENIWIGELGCPIEYIFEQNEDVGLVRLIFDSDLNRGKGKGETLHEGMSDMRCFYPLDQEPVSVPQTLIKSFYLEVLDDSGQWKKIFSENDNYQRLVKIPVNMPISGIRLVPLSTWGENKARIFSFELYPSKSRNAKSKSPVKDVVCSQNL